MGNNTKVIGELSEGMILAAFLRARKVVLQPFGDNQRYDLVVDNDGTFVRVQCKTGRTKNGFIEFDTCSSQLHRKDGKKHGYKGQADLFAVYVSTLDRIFVVPVGTVGDTGCRLRLDPPKNAQQKRVRLARDFDFESRVDFYLSSFDSKEQTRREP